MIAFRGCEATAPLKQPGGQVEAPARRLFRGCKATAPLMCVAAGRSASFRRRNLARIAEKWQAIMPECVSAP